MVGQLAPFVNRVMERVGIRVHVPVPDWEQNTGYYGLRQFTYDAQRDVYVCPQGQPLRPGRLELIAQKVEYRANAASLRRTRS